MSRSRPTAEKGLATVSPTRLETAGVRQGIVEVRLRSDGDVYASRGWHHYVKGKALGGRGRERGGG